MSLVFTEYKIFKSPKSQAKRRGLINFSFLNEGVQLITLTPTYIKFDNTTVAYSLINPIRSKIFNFDIFIHNLDVKVFF